jgi:hypothetical protein
MSQEFRSCRIQENLTPELLNFRTPEKWLFICLVEKIDLCGES